jgi:hypothetical protein
MDAAVRGVAAKLEAFHDGLAPEEQQAFDTALRRVGARGNLTTEDATGYAIPLGLLPLIVVNIVEQLRQQSAQRTQHR